jgi:hypothetical protein
LQGRPAARRGPPFRRELSYRLGDVPPPFTWEALA